MEETTREMAIPSERNGSNMKIFKNWNKKNTGIFAAGVLFGTAGISLLSSKDAKKLYTNCTAAVLRAKKCVMDKASVLQENCEDIYADARQINEERATAEEAEFEDASEKTEEGEQA